jgi:hypothetical protein
MTERRTPCIPIGEHELFRRPISQNGLCPLFLKLEAIRSRPTSRPGQHYQLSICNWQDPSLFRKFVLHHMKMSRQPIFSTPLTRQLLGISTYVRHVGITSLRRPFFLHFLEAVFRRQHKPLDWQIVVAWDKRIGHFKVVRSMPA